MLSYSRHTTMNATEFELDDLSIRNLYLIINILIVLIKHFPDSIKISINSRLKIPNSVNFLLFPLQTNTKVVGI